MSLRVHIAGEQLQDVARVLKAAGCEIAESPEDAIALLDRRDVEAQLRRIIHDLRTPLNAISGYSEMLLEEEDPPTRQRYAANIVKAAAQLNEQLRVLASLSET